jgi:hypothetical protein
MSRPNPLDRPMSRELADALSLSLFKKNPIAYPLAKKLMPVLPEPVVVPVILKNKQYYISEIKRLNVLLDEPEKADSAMDKRAIVSNIRKLQAELLELEMEEEDVKGAEADEDEDEEDVFLDEGQLQIKQLEERMMDLQAQIKDTDPKQTRMISEKNKEVNRLIKLISDLKRVKVSKNDSEDNEDEEDDEDEEEDDEDDEDDGEVEDDEDEEEDEDDEDSDELPSIMKAEKEKSVIDFKRRETEKNARFKMELATVMKIHADVLSHMKMLKDTIPSLKNITLSQKQIVTLKVLKILHGIEPDVIHSLLSYYMDYNLENIPRFIIETRENAMSEYIKMTTALEQRIKELLTSVLEQVNKEKLSGKSSEEQDAFIKRITDEKANPVNKISLDSIEFKEKSAIEKLIAEYKTYQPTLGPLVNTNLNEKFDVINVVNMFVKHDVVSDYGSFTNPIWSKFTESNGLSTMFSETKTDYKLVEFMGFMSYMLLNPDQILSWQQLFYDWPMFQHLYAKHKTQLNSDMSSVDKPVAISKTQAEITKLVQDFYANHNYPETFILLDSYLSKEISKIASQSKEYVKSFYNWVLNFRFTLPKTMSVYEPILGLAPAGSQHLPELTYVASTDTFQYKPRPIVTESAKRLIDEIKEVKQFQREQKESYVNPRPNTRVLLSKNKEELSEYIYQCNNPSILKDGQIKKAVEFTHKDAKESFHMIETMYIAIAKLFIIKKREQKSSDNEPNTKIAFEAFIKELVGKNIKRLLEELQRTDPQENWTEIIKMNLNDKAWNVVKSAMFPLSVKTVEKKIFSIDGYTRRSIRKKHREQNEDTSVLGKKTDVELCNDLKYQNIMISSVDGSIPPIQYAYTHVAYYIKTDDVDDSKHEDVEEIKQDTDELKEFYKPTFYTRQQLCTSEIDISPQSESILIDGVFSFKLAYYDDKNQLIPFNEIDYQSLQSLAEIEPDLPFSYIFAQNQSIIKNRIFSMINVDVDDISFCSNLWSLIKNKPIQIRLVTIQNVLTVFYFCVALKHSAFQLNIDKIPEIKERILSLSPSFTNDVNVPWLLKSIFQMNGKSELVRDIEIYISSFVSSLLCNAFPYIRFKNTPMPCFSMFYSDEEVSSVLTLKPAPVVSAPTPSVDTSSDVATAIAATKGIKCRHLNQFPTIHLNHTGAKHLMICEKCAHSKKFLK